MENDYYLWLCFTDRGIVYFNGNTKLDFIQKLFLLQGICNFECHYVNDDAILCILQSYLEDCFGLEYIGGLYE